MNKYFNIEGYPILRDLVDTIKNGMGNVEQDMILVLKQFKTNKSYKQNEIIFQEGKFYQSKVDFTSADTFVEADWNLIDTGGEGGLEPWTNEEPYNAGDIVIYNNRIVRSLIDNNLNNIPAIVSTSWEFIDTTRVASQYNFNSIENGEMFFDQPNAVDGLYRKSSSDSNYFTYGNRDLIVPGIECVIMVYKSNLDSIRMHISRDDIWLKDGKLYRALQSFTKIEAFNFEDIYKWEEVTVDSRDVSFLDLTDTPTSFTANKLLAVNASGNGIAFVDAPEGGAFTVDAKGNLKTSIANEFAGGTGSNNIIAGRNAGQNTVEGSFNIFIGDTAAGGGNGSMRGSRNIGIGQETYSRVSSFFVDAIAIGYCSLKWNSGYSNVVGLGASASVTASNQIQLGNSQTTVYSYASASRSDRRDKSDIKDNPLGLDFIMALRPRQFRWNFREDYRENVEEEMFLDGISAKAFLSKTLDEQLSYLQSKDENIKSFNIISSHNESPYNVVLNVSKLMQLENDESKKRIREHNGFIAQEVKELMDELDIDFAGFQNHAYNGDGEDVLSISYQEFISPLTKSVQELKTQKDQEIEQLKQENNKLKQEIELIKQHLGL